MIKEKRSGILATIDSKTKVMGLTALAAEVLFLGALATLPSEQTVWALTICAVILVVTIIGIVIVEVTEAKVAEPPPMQPSPLTPDLSLLNELVNGAIQTVCRAVSVPQSPESANLRAFIFRKEGNQLVCTHYWSPNPAREMVGKLRFEINASVAERVAVVRAVINEGVCQGACRTPVEPLPKDLNGVEGEVSENLSFVLAAPIIDQSGSIWGVVDFDTGNDIGKSLLQTEVSDSVMFQLAKHIRVIFSLTDTDGLKTA